MNKGIQIVVIDDDIIESDPLIIRLKMHFENVTLFKSPYKGLDYCHECISAGQRIVVVLDFKFEAFDGYTGEQFLREIRLFSNLIPVILRSAYVGSGTSLDRALPEFINLKTFGIFRKSDIKETVDKVIEAVEKVNSSVEGALEEWLVIEQERGVIKSDQPYLINIEGKDYTLDEILREIRMETPFGLKTKKDLEMLTIDLLIRRRENL